MKRLRNIVNKDSRSLWKNINRMRGDRVPFSSRVGDESTPEGIAELFMSNHRDLMNCVGRGRQCHDELNARRDIDSFSSDMIISSDEVKLACASLN